MTTGTPVAIQPSNDPVTARGLMRLEYRPASIAAQVDSTISIRMGYASSRRNVLLCLGALDAVLSDLGAPVQSGAAVPAAMKVYAGA